MKNVLRRPIAPAMRMPSQPLAVAPMRYSAVAKYTRFRYGMRFDESVCRRQAKPKDKT
mgnify:CR=1 FL=1